MVEYHLTEAQLKGVYLALVLVLFAVIHVVTNLGAVQSGAVTIAFGVGGYLVLDNVLDIEEVRGDGL